MSEWLDFALYAFQIALLAIFMPRQSVRFAVPAIADRDPEWPAAHPEAVRCIERSRWLLNTSYAYAAVCITLLLALRLGLEAPLFSRASGDTPSWEILKDAHATMLIVVLVGYFASFFTWTRWLALHVPLAARRNASLKPRLVSDYVSRFVRVSTQVLAAGHVAAWLVVAALGLAGGAGFWWRFAFVVAMTVLFAVIAHLVPRRRPGYPDRLFGESFRRVEIRVAYVMQLVPLMVSAVGIAELITRIDFARAAHLLIVALVCMWALVFLRLRPIGPGAGAPGSYSALVGERRSAA